MNQFKRTNKALYVDYGTRINPEATAADLFAAVFSDPNTSGLDIHAQVMGVVDDELTLLIDAMASTDDVDTDLCQRVLLRVQTNIKIANALRDRFEAAEKELELPEAAE